MSLETLTEVLALADESPDKTARSKVSVQKVIDEILMPIEAKIAEIQGPKTIALTGHTGRTKPQFVAELRCEVPEDRDVWIPQMRIALSNDSKKDAALELGFTVAQAWSDDKKDEQYPAHIRWGIWIHATDKVRPVQGPLAIMGRAVGGGMIQLPTRPITNKPANTLSMLGKMRGRDEIGEFASLDALAQEVATDLMLLSRALLR